MKRVVYLFLLAIGIITWAISILSMFLTMWFAAKGHKLFPNTDVSNCWIFALTKYYNQSGYLLIRPADDVRLFKKITIPHVIYTKTIPPDLIVEQFVPTKRSLNKWFPWKTLWYKGTIKTTERPH